MSDPDTGPSSDFFDAAYQETPPWDIGAGQPALLALFDEFPPAGPALDVGCGAGALVFALRRSRCGRHRASKECCRRAYT